MADLEAELRFYKEREQHFAKLLKVTDNGQYRADWDGAIARLIRERDEAVAEAEKLRKELAKIRVKRVVKKVRSMVEKAKKRTS